MKHKSPLKLDDKIKGRLLDSDLPWEFSEYDCSINYYESKDKQKIAKNKYTFKDLLGDFITLSEPNGIKYRVGSLSKDNYESFYIIGINKKNLLTELYKLKIPNAYSSMPWYNRNTKINELINKKAMSTLPEEDKREIKNNKDSKSLGTITVDSYYDKLRKILNGKGNTTAILNLNSSTPELIIYLGILPCLHFKKSNSSGNSCHFILNGMANLINYTNNNMNLKFERKSLFQYIYLYYCQREDLEKKLHSYPGKIGFDHEGESHNPREFNYTFSTIKLCENLRRKEIHHLEDRAKLEYIFHWKKAQKLNLDYEIAQLKEIKILVENLTKSLEIINQNIISESMLPKKGSPKLKDLTYMDDTGRIFDYLETAYKAYAGSESENQARLIVLAYKMNTKVENLKSCSIEDIVTKLKEFGGNESFLKDSLDIFSGTCETPSRNYQPENNPFLDGFLNHTQKTNEDENPSNPNSNNENYPASKYA
ncbi:hypothetical protein [Microbulbifer sp. THAF38]|uniref:hypothetical protein n=1 Tax=Microbulbifer sp. THAF38 TaxID=2587856 RepID=UPI0012685461|nr:hypothetical protein [Microbulbifer sp. THAF38]QFT55347.1 hypothetical protein FIU95_12355 [Microbulbifer sp. THAF38]